MDTHWFVNFSVGISFKFVFFNSLVLLLLCFLRGDKNKMKGKRSYSKSLKKAKFTSISLPLIDRLIAPLKAKTGDARFLENLFYKAGMNCRIPFLHSEIIAITEPNVVQRILSSKHLGHLNKPQFFYQLVCTDLIKNGLLGSTLDFWSLHRKAIVESFNYNAFPTYLKYINEGAKTMMNSALSKSLNFGSGSVVVYSEMKPVIYQSTLQIITQIILGEDVSEISQQSLETFHQTHQRWKTIMLERLLNPLLILEPIWKFHPKRRELESCIGNLLSFEYSFVDRYRSRLQTNSGDGQPLNKSENFQCMIERMINAGMTNKEIADEIGTFMLAGHETIVVAIEMLSFHLALYPEHQKRCQEEIDLIFCSQIDEHEQDLGLDQLSELKFLERCILESLRLTPPVPMFFRQLETPLEIEKDLILDVGEIVMISPWMAHRNPTYYPNPEIFDPDRFLPENVKMRPKQAFIPFSMGQRNCVGWKVALMEMKVLMANILKTFDLTTKDKVDDIKIQFDITIKPDRPFNINFTKRE